MNSLKTGSPQQHMHSLLFAQCNNCESRETEEGHTDTQIHFLLHADYSYLDDTNALFLESESAACFADSIALEQQLYRPCSTAPSHCLCSEAPSFCETEPSRHLEVAVLLPRRRAERSEISSFVLHGARQKHDALLL